MASFNWLKRKSPRSKRDDLDATWLVVFSSGHQYGPFKASEIVNLVETKALAVAANVCRTESPGQLVCLADVLPSMIESISAERRGGQARTYCHAEVQVRRLPDEDSAMRAKCVDISVGGLFVEADAKLTVGEQVHITIQSPLLASPIVESAKIVRRSERSGYALQFLFPSEQTIATISQFVHGERASTMGIAEASLLNAG